MSIQIRVAGLVVSAIIASAANAQTAVEWKVSEGGNGHWYQTVTLPYGSSWFQAADYATIRGGHLGTITSGAENRFVLDLVGVSGPWFSPDSSPPGILQGPFLGARRMDLRSGWSWCTGEPWTFSAWCSNQPSNTACPDPELALMIKLGDLCDRYSGWGDIPLSGSCLPEMGGLTGAVVEWESDCNHDGIVDYGQILRGELPDDNQNGVPDICEYTVTGVIPVSGPAGGGTSIIVNGTNLPENPTVLVGGSPATNVVRVSPTRLTAVTPAGLPGMTSVTVGNWVQPNAFYYRPECGSDLDQNGTVDAGDISIILLDFGPCYEPPAALAAPTPTPLLAAEPAQKTGTAKKE